MEKRVREIMTVSPETLSPDSSMQDAVMLEMRRRIRHIPIVENGVLVGILTDRDLKRAMPSLLSGNGREEHERVLETTKVSQLMTRSPLTIAPDAQIREAVRLLVDKKFGALPVVDGAKLVGIISEVDLLRCFLEMLESR